MGFVSNFALLKFSGKNKFPAETIKNPKFKCSFKRYELENYN